MSTGTNTSTGGRIASRRRFLAAGAGLVGLGALAACGSSDSGSGAGASGSASTGGAFPVTVKHMFGSTTVEAAPAKVAAMGYTDADTLLALGIVPVAMAESNPDWAKGVGPWAEALMTTTPQRFSAPFDYEKVGALLPDLITDVWSSQEKAEWESFDGLAPTVGPVPGYPAYGAPWNERALLIATAVGQKDKGAELVAKAEKSLTDAKAANPDLAGLSTIMVWNYNDTLGAYPSTDPRARFLESLGLQPSEFATSMTDAQKTAGVSTEQVTLLEADVVVVQCSAGQTKDSFLKDYPVFSTLPAAKEGRVAFVEDYDVVMSLYTSSVLSMQYAVDGFLPLLKAAAAKAG